MQKSLVDKEFIAQLPKAELHLHIEGTLEPEMMLKLAKRNNIRLKHDSIEQIKLAYKFEGLQDFLDIYFAGMSVLLSEEDFFDLTYAYLEEAHRNNITYCEIFFDPQAHLVRNIAFTTFINGMSSAINVAKLKLGVDAKLIMCFLRHLPEAQAIKTFEIAMNYRDKFIGIGLDSTETANPPIKFKRLFDMARSENLHLVAHAGEEGPVEYIWQVIDDLGVVRIDHGYRATEDIVLMERLIKDQIPLTMCPLSNKALKVCEDLAKYPAKIMLDKGVCITINSDDPAYFGGYINDNYLALAEGLLLSKQEIEQIVQNSFRASFN